MKREYVHLNCCDGGAKTVFLRVEEDEFVFGGYPKPTWRIHRWLDDRQCYETAIVQYCPHCGIKVPDVVPVEPAPQTMRVTDGGYYCDTCKKRLHACQCLYPEQAWRIADE